MKIKETWFSDIKIGEGSIVENYLRIYKEFVESLSPHKQYKESLSGLNRIQRGELWQNDNLASIIRPGDICYLDYGQAFINEAGYQHFGIVVSIFHHKLLVVPMTSNASTIQNARNVSPEGKKHLYFLGKVKGLNKPSVLFLNDIKFINSSRVISINGHLNPEDSMFQEIVNLLIDEIFGIVVIK